MAFARSVRRSVASRDSTPRLYRSHNAAEVNDFDPADFVERKKVKRLDRFGTFSIACAKQAIDDAGIDLAAEDRERIGVMMGSALGGIRFAEEQLEVFLTKGIRAVEPALALERVRRRRELQHRDRARRDGAEQHQRDELRVGHDRHRRRLPRRSATTTPT